MQPRRVKGVVKWFSNQKGFGFIGQENGSDVFVHYSAVQSDRYRKLVEGDQVEFEMDTGRDGRPQATNVVKLR